MVKSCFPLAIIFIIAVEFCERLCYYTFLGTQKTFLQDQGYSNAQSSSINLVWSEVSYVSCFLGGWLASTKIGIFNTIAVLALTYAVGTFLGAFAAWPSVQDTEYSVNIYLFAVFGLVALGCGGIKPNVPTMGANQIDPTQPGAEEARSSFFLYFYMSINAGSCFSHAFLSSWATSGVPWLGIDIEYGYFFAWSVAGGFMLLATLIFVAGKKSYRIPVRDDENTKEGVLSILFNALKSGSGTFMGKIAIFGWTSMPVFVFVSIANAFMDNYILQYISSFLAFACVVSLVIAHINNSWLPEGPVSQAFDIVPMILVGNSAFHILMSAVGSSFQSQACQMDTRQDKSDFSYEGFQYTGDFFRLANPIGCILGVPLLDRVIYPFVAKLRGKEVGIAFKIVAGFLVAISGQLFAAVLEYQRKAAPVLDVQSHCAPYVEGSDTEHVRMSDMNSMWMFFPYALVGIGEVMVNPVLQFIAYERSPPEMKPLVQAFNLFSSGALGNGIASVISQQLSGLVPNNLNYGNLQTFYYVNTGVGIAGILAFLAAYHMAPERVKRHGDAKTDPKGQAQGDQVNSECSSESF